jgi:hypothetical protein
MTLYEDAPLALLQRMTGLERAGLRADFPLHDGLEIRIEKIRTPLLVDFTQVRKPC